jgi:hypothetical protein
VALAANPLGISTQMRVPVNVDMKPPEGRSHRSMWVFAKLLAQNDAMNSTRHAPIRFA